MPMSCSVSPISGTRSVEAVFGHKTPHDKSKTESPTANYGWFVTLTEQCWVISKWVTATNTWGCLGFEKQLFGSSSTFKPVFSPC